MSESYSVKAILSAEDKGFSSIFGGAQSALGALDSSLKSGLSFGVMAGIGQAAFNAVAGTVKSLATDVLGVGKAFESSMSQVQATKGILDASAAFEQLDTAALASNSTFQKVAESLDIASDGTVNTMDALSALASQMGADTKFTAAQAADAINNLSMAGMDTQGVFENLPTVLNLATAGNLDLDYSAQLVANGLAVMGDNCSGAEEMADKLAVTASSAYGSVSDFGEGLLTAGGQANLCGLSLTDTYTALGILGNNGMQASEGGTMLRNTLKNLYQPTDKAAAALDSLGVKTADAEGNLRPMQDVLKDLGSAMDELSPEERTQMMAEIFDTRTIAGATALIENCGEAWDELADKIDNAEGAASRMAETQLDNLEGDVTIFGSAVDGLKKSIYDNFNAPMRIATKLATAGISSVTSKLKALGNVFDSFDVGAVADAIDTGGLSAGMEELATQVSEQFDSIIDTAIEKGPETISNFAQGIADGIPSVMSSMNGVTSKLMAAVTANLPAMISGGAEIVRSLLSGISANAPAFIASAGSMISTFLSSVNENLPSLMTSGAEMLISIASGLAQNLPMLISMGGTTISTFRQTLAMLLPSVLAAGAQLLSSVVSGIAQALPQIIVSGTQTVVSFVLSLIQMLPTVLSAGISLLVSIAQGVLQALPVLVSGAVQAISMFVQTVTQCLPSVLSVGMAVLVQLAQGLASAIPTLVVAALQGIVAIISTIVSSLPIVLSAGLEIVQTLSSGMLQSLPTIVATVLQGMLLLVQAVVQSLPAILQMGGVIISNLVQGLIQNVPQIVTAMLYGLTMLIQAISANLPAVLQAGVELIGMLVNGIVQNLPMVLSAAVAAIQALLQGLAQNLPLIVSAGIQIIGQLIMGLAQAVPMIGRSGWEIIKTLGSSIAEAIPNIITNAVSGIKGIFSDVWNFITGKTEEAAGEAAQSTQEMADNMNSAMSSVNSEGASELTGFAEQVASQAQSASDQAAGSFEDMQSAFASSIDGLDSSGFDSLFDSLSTSTEGLSTSFEGMGTTATGSMDTLMQSVSDSASGITESIGKIGTGTDDILSGMTSSFESTAGDLTGIFNGMDFGGSFDSLDTSADSALSSLTSSFETASSDVSSISLTMGEDTATNLIDSLSSVPSDVSSTMSGYASNITAGGTTAAKNATTTATKVNKNLKSGSKGASSAGKTVGDAYSKAFLNAAVKAIAYAKSIATRVNSALSAGRSGASSAGTSVGSAYASGVRGQSGSASSAGSAVKSSAVSGMNGGSSTAYSLGAAFGQGYVNGINSKAAAARAAGANLAANAAAGTQSQQKSGSPSRVAASLGADYSDGYAIGIASGTSKVLAAAKKTVKAVTAVSGAADLKAAVIKAMNGLTKYGTTYLKDSLAKLKSAVTKGNFSSIATSVANSFKTAYTSKASKYTDSVKASIKSVTEQLKKSATAQADSFTQQKKDAEAARKKYKKGSAEYKKYTKQINEYAKKAKQAKADASSYTKAGTAMTTAFTKQFNAMRDKAVTTATNALKKIGEKYQEKYDAIIEARTSFYETLSDVGSLYTADDYGYVKLKDFDAAAKQLKQYQANLKKLKTVLPEGLMNEIIGMETQEGLEYTNELLKMSSKDLKKYGQSYSKYISTASGISKDYYAKQIADVKSAYTKEVKKVNSDLQKQMAQIGKNAVSALVKAMGTQSKSVSDAGKAMMQTMMGSIEKSLVASYKSQAAVLAKSGKYTVDGLYKAIVKNLGLTTTAGREMAKSVAQSYAKTMKIHSPSKVMYALGDDTAAGAINALEARERDMWEAAGKLVRIPSLAAADAPDMEIRASRDYSLDEDCTYHHESTVYVPLYINSRKFAEACADDITDEQNRHNSRSLRKRGAV